MSGRIVWRNHGTPGDAVRLVHVDVTDPAIHAQKPYRLVRVGHLGHHARLCDLNTAELKHLRDALTRELEQRGEP